MVTVALGSTPATVLLSKDVPLVEGVLGFTVLAALQFAIAWVALRVAPIENAIKSSPRVLLRDGVIDHAALLSERVTRDEVSAGVREGGHGDIGAIALVALETNGSFNVITNAKAGDCSAFPDR